MKIRPLCWLTVPVLLGVTSFLVARWQGRQEAPVRPLDPVVEYPAIVDLGERENGEQAIGRFSIANRGVQELVIDQVRTNCSCTGLEREEEGRFVHLESVRLKPGQQANLAVRVAVRGVPVGASMHNVIEFQTNDPGQPTGRMDVFVRRVWGGVSINPPEVVFAPVAVGATVRKVLEIRDTATIPRTIGRVTSTDPKRLTVRLLPAETLPKEAEPNPGGTLIGQVEVVVDTSEIGEVSGVVRVGLVGETRPPDEAQVAGRVTASVELRSSSLVLPRLTADGPLYSAQTLCRSTHGKALTVAADPAPMGLTVQIESSGDATSKIVRITWDPTRGILSDKGQRQWIKLRARAGEEEVVLKLAVVLQ